MRVVIKCTSVNANSSKTIVSSGDTVRSYLPTADDKVPLYTMFVWHLRHSTVGNTVHQRSRLQTETQRRKVERGRREKVNVADTGTRVILNNEDSYSEKYPVPNVYYALRLLFQLFSRWARTASVGWMETVSVACASCVVFTLRTTRYHPSADRPFRTSGRTKRILKIVGKEISLLSCKCLNQLVPGTIKK